MIIPSIVFDKKEKKKKEKKKKEKEKKRIIINKLKT
jgi:hypothetical protein